MGEIFVNKEDLIIIIHVCINTCRYENSNFRWEICAIFSEEAKPKFIHGSCMQESFEEKKRVLRK